MGIKKVYHCICKDLRLAEIKIGRDGIYQIARDNNLIIKPKKRHRVSTTDASSWRRQHADLRENFKPLLPEQLWVCDITYIRVDGGFVYLSLITDACSRQIMGWHVHAYLSTTGCLLALDKALKARQYPKRKLIHHSDRGCQYCSADYVAKLRENGIAISMTQTGSPYDNPMAESVNGQLKEEYNLDQTFADIDEAIKATAKAINMYIQHRPHGSIELRKPAEYHRSFSQSDSSEQESAPVCQLPAGHKALASTKSRKEELIVN